MKKPASFRRVCRELLSEWPLIPSCVGNRLGGIWVRSWKSPHLTVRWEYLNRHIETQCLPWGNASIESITFKLFKISLRTLNSSLWIRINLLNCLSSTESTNKISHFWTFIKCSYFGNQHPPEISNVQMPLMWQSR